MEHRHVRRLKWLAACGWPIVAELLVGGCGSGDDSSAPSKDAGGDATLDASSGSDAASADSGLDGTVSDGAQDGGNDADAADSSDGAENADVSDGGSNAADVAVDAPSIGDFVVQVTAALCRRLETCCLLSDMSWNQTLCINDIQAGGGFRELNEFSASIDSGNILYSPITANKCISDMVTIPCAAAISAVTLTLQSECYAALAGTLGVDAGPCKTSIECATNEYCNAGTCSPVLGTNQPCTRNLNDQCVYRGGQSAYCDLPSQGGAGQCEPTLPNDAGCNSNGQCQSGLCDFPCGNQEVFADPGVPSGTCAFYTIPDAGSD
jgi:hypothetical protein